jgi:hypothetical protein
MRVKKTKNSQLSLVGVTPPLHHPRSLPEVDLCEGGGLDLGLFGGKTAPSLHRLGLAVFR